MKRILCLLLAAMMLFGGAFAEGEMPENVKNAYQTTGDYIESLGAPQVGSVGGEWMVIGLARSGREVPESYYASAEAYVRENADEHGQLHRVKSTENSRMILALTAIGADVTNVAGYNLLEPLGNMNFLAMQGNNGPIWALIALDCGDYELPDDANYTREMLVQSVLNMPARGRRLGDCRRYRRFGYDRHGAAIAREILPARGRNGGLRCGRQSRGGRGARPAFADAV